MTKLFQFIFVFALGVILSLGIYTIPHVRSAKPNQNQEFALKLVQAGKEYYDAGQFLASTQTLQKAAEIYEAIKDIPKQAQTLSFISLAYQQLGHWEKAESAMDLSRSLLEILPRDGQISLIRAQVLNHQGRLQLARGTIEAARETFQDAELLYSQADDRVGIIGSQINQAQVLQTLGLYRQAQNLFTQIEQKLEAEPDSMLKLAGLHNLGNLLLQVGNLERSQEILELSLSLAQQLSLSQKQSKVLLSLGNTERALAKRAEAFNQKQEAENYNREALNHYQEAATTTLSIIKVQAQLNQLSLLIETNQLASAQVLGSQISTILNQLPASRTSIYARVNFVHSLMTLSLSVSEVQLIDQSAQILTTAVQQAKNMEDQRAESYVLGTLGELYEKTEDWTKAKQLTKSALLIAQGIQAPDIAYQWQWQIGRLLQAQAENTLQSRNADPEAIAYYTQAFNILNNLRSDLVVLNPEVQFSFREKVEPVYRQLVDLLLRSPEPTKDNLIQARKVIEGLQLAELNNFFRDACAKPEEVNIDDLDPGAAVIYPIILDDRLEVILKLPGADNLHHYVNNNISETQVDAAVKRLQKSLKRRSTSLSQVKTESQQLYNWLIRPFQAELKSSQEYEQRQIKTLVFVLDGSLRNVPMAALYDGQHYLIERYAIAVTPGLQLIDPKPLLREPLTALIAGATNAPSFQLEELAPLDNVKIELLGIEQEIKSQKLENQEFNQEKFQSQINSASFNIIHMATHGQFSSQLEQTFILDWNKRIGVKDLDSLLRRSDQKEVKPIELLILSACETAVGDKRAALGLAGIAIRAGARSTLASLWQIDDASTAQFMIQFYQQLNNPQIAKADALRQVQLAFLRNYPNTDYNRPYHWASFTLVGNWL